jgi:hypothetical protein
VRFVVLYLYRNRRSNRQKWISLSYYNDLRETGNKILNIDVKIKNQGYRRQYPVQIRQQKAGARKESCIL